MRKTLNEDDVLKEIDRWIGYLDEDMITRIKIRIKKLPSAQPELIWCGECKHSEHWYRDKARCFLWVEDGIDVFEDGYCNYAERKEGDEMMTRKEAIARIKDHMSVHKMHEERAVKITEALNMAISALEQPEIIRCKDCAYMTEHYDTDGNAPYWTCSEWDSGTDYDGFCHYAERKEGTE